MWIFFKSTQQFYSNYHETNQKPHSKKRKLLKLSAGPSGSLTEPSCSLPSFLQPLTSKNHGGTFLQNKVSDAGKLCLSEMTRGFPRATASWLFLMTSAQAESTSDERPCGKRTWTVENITGVNIRMTHTHTQIGDVNENQLNWWYVPFKKCHLLEPHTFTFISKGCFAAHVWLPSMNLNIFPSFSSLCVCRDWLWWPFGLGDPGKQSQLTGQGGLQQDISVGYALARRPLHI